MERVRGTGYVLMDAETIRTLRLWVESMTDTELRLTIIETGNKGGITEATFRLALGEYFRRLDNDELFINRRKK